MGALSELALMLLSGALRDFNYDREAKPTSHCPTYRMNKKLYPLYLCALSLCAASARAQTTTTTTTTATPAAPAAAPAAAACSARSPAAAPTSPVSTPSMEGPLTVNLKPESFDIPDFGKIYVSGAVTAIALADTPTFYGEKSGIADISNAQVFIQKVDGEFQFFLDAGAYSFPTVGVPYPYSGNTMSATFGALPIGFVKYAPNANFSHRGRKTSDPHRRRVRVHLREHEHLARTPLEPGAAHQPRRAGQPTRRARWPATCHGMTASIRTATTGPRAPGTWTINSSNTLEFVIGGNLGTTDYGTSATPEVVNNDKEILNLIYSFTSGALDGAGLLPVRRLRQLARKSAGSRTRRPPGVGVLVNYAVPNTSWNLSARGEEISSSGSTTDGSVNLLYGPGSKAWSFTFTPSYQVGVLFARAEVSFVGASSTTAGYAFGKTGNSTSQTRFAIETGILF